MRCLMGLVVAMAAAVDYDVCSEKEYGYFRVAEIVRFCSDSSDAKYIGDCIDSLVDLDVGQACFDCAIRSLQKLDGYRGECRDSCAAGDDAACTECTELIGFAIGAECAKSVVL